MSAPDGSCDIACNAKLAKRCEGLFDGPPLLSPCVTALKSLSVLTTLVHYRPHLVVTRTFSFSRIVSVATQARLLLLLLISQLKALPTC